MSRKVLEFLGLAALLLLAGGGVAAWLVVKQRIHVTIQEGDPVRADDPVALLRDEVRQVETEVRLLREGLAKSLVNLAEAQGKEAQERDVASTRQQTAAREESARALAACEARLLERLAALEMLLASTPAASAQPSLESPRVESRPSAPALAASQPETASLEAAPPEPGSLAPSVAPRPRRSSFLAFDLPSDSFHFAGSQTFEVVPSLSRVGFDAKSTLHDFTGATTDVGGELRTDLSSPARAAAGRIWARARSLDTGLPDRNDAMKEHLDATRHELIEFTIESFETQALDAPAMTLRGTVTGTMAIRGTSHRFSMPVSMSVDESRRLCVGGSAALKTSEFGIEVPTKLGIVKFTDEVQVWVALKLRAKRGS